MPQLSKTQVRALVRQLADDPAGKLWSTNNLDLLIEGALDELWGELLDAFPWLNMREDTIAATSPGYIDLQHTSDATGTSLIRYYRIHQVVRDGQLYRQAHPNEIVFVEGEAVSAPDQSYAIYGNQIYLFPLATTDVTVRYSAFPEPFTSLSSSEDPDDGEDDEEMFVTWPDGYHLVYAYDVASRMLEKGDREESARLKQRAETSLFRLKAFLRKQTTNPIMPILTDSNFDWGGT